MQNGEHYDIFVLLQPTSPLRSAKDIDSTIQLLIDNPDYNSAITVKPVGSSHPNYLYKTVNDSGEMTPYFDNSIAEVRRQEFADIYVRNGAVYAVNTSYMLENCKLLDEQVLVHQIQSHFLLRIGITPHLPQRVMIDYP